MIREYRFFGQLAGERELGFDELRDGQEDGVQCLAFLMDLKRRVNFQAYRRKLRRSNKIILTISRTFEHALRHSTLYIAWHPFMRFQAPR